MSALSYDVLVSDGVPRVTELRMPDDPAILGQTRQYLLDAQRLLGQRPSPREYFDQMVAKYPDSLNQAPVWYSALALRS